MIFHNEKFKELRIKKGFSVSDITKQTGLSRVSIWAWENGKTVPSAKNVKILAAAVKHGVNEISDLEADAPSMELPLAGILKPYTYFNEIKTIERLDSRSKVLDIIDKLYDDLAQATTIINSILCYIPSMFYIKDLKLNYVTANKSFVDYYMDKESINSVVTGKTDFDFFPKNDAIRNTEQDKQAIKTGIPVKKNIDYMPGSRNKKWALISKYPITDTQNRIIGLIGSFVDVTEEKEADELRELLEINVKNMSEGFTVYDVNKEKYLFVNNAIEEIFGYNLEKFKAGGRKFWINTCLHPDDRSEIEIFNKSNKWPKVYEYRIIRPNGEIRWIRTRSFPETFYRGTKCNVNIDSDITNLKDVHFLELIEFSLNGITDGFELMEEETRKPVFANDAVETIFGYSKKQITCFDFWINNCVHPDDREEQLKIIKGGGDIPTKRRYRIVRPDGEVKCLETSRWVKEFHGKKYLAVINRIIAESSV